MKVDLKDVRLRLGLTQQALAMRADVSVSLISKLEMGLRSTVSPRIAHKLAAACGMSWEEFMGRTKRKRAMSAARL